MLVLGRSFPLRMLQKTRLLDTAVPGMGHTSWKDWSFGQNSGEQGSNATPRHATKHVSRRPVPRACRLSADHLGLCVGHRRGLHWRGFGLHVVSGLRRRYIVLSDALHKVINPMSSCVCPTTPAARKVCATARSLRTYHVHRQYDSPLPPTTT